MRWPDITGAGAPLIPVHGGNLGAARRRFPHAPEPWIDLSTGINPNRYPFQIGALPERIWTRLPEPAEIAHLEAVAAAAYDLATHGRVVAASGTQPLIQMLPHLIPARRVAILGFGYQEHPTRWRAAGAQIRIVDTLEALGSEDVDLAVVINPNNPDGRLIDRSRLVDLAERLAARGGHLVVDEAFMDVVRPSQSLAAILPAGTIVLRSFGKAYGLAGLRLGFVLAEAGMAERMRELLGPWPVSGPAIAVGIEALSDGAWLQLTIAELDIAVRRLDALLERAGLTVLGGTRLFRLATSPRAGEWFNRLGEAGILIRAFTEQPKWLRIGLPGDEGAWRRLGAALAR